MFISVIHLFVAVQRRLHTTSMRQWNLSAFFMGKFNNRSKTETKKTPSQGGR